MPPVRVVRYAVTLKRRTSWSSCSAVRANSAAEEAIPCVDALVSWVEADTCSNCEKMRFASAPSRRGPSAASVSRASAVRASISFWVSSWPFRSPSSTERWRTSR